MACAVVEPRRRREARHAHARRARSTPGRRARVRPPTSITSTLVPPPCIEAEQARTPCFLAWTMPSAPSAPLFVLRHHSAQINALSFVLPTPAPADSSSSATRSSSSSRTARTRPALLCSGDADGWVAITDLQSRRALCIWQAHTDGVLGIEQWDGSKLITYALARPPCLSFPPARGPGLDRADLPFELGKRPICRSGRDNKLHVWQLPAQVPSLGRLSSAASAPPALLYSMDVNSLNYCRFSVLPSPSEPGEAWIAMPNLTDSETVRACLLGEPARARGPDRAPSPPRAALACVPPPLPPSPDRHLPPAVAAAATRGHRVRPCAELVRARARRQRARQDGSVPSPAERLPRPWPSG